MYIGICVFIILQIQENWVLFMLFLTTRSDLPTSSNEIELTCAIKLL